jgi:hypothetical protein
VHRSVSPLDQCRNPPSTCAIETEADETTARELGTDPMEVLPADARARVNALIKIAEETAADAAFPLDGARGALITLIQGRIPLVTSDAQLRDAEQATRRLVSATIRNATKRQFHAVNEFFLTEALFDLNPLFPYTD